MTDTHAELWAKLAAPFDASQIEKLPKNVRAKDEDRGTCARGSRYSADGHYCGKYHARAVHLDYVGHGGITMRLNDVLGPEGWDFQPYAVTADGLPVITQSMFYAKLTILGVTKWDMAANFNGPQEAYGDALRRCAMRFGIGTYLWSKSEAAAALAAGEPLSAAESDSPPTHAPDAAERAEAPRTPGEVLLAELNALTDPEAAMVRANWPAGLGDPTTLTAEQADAVRVVIATAKAATEGEN